MTDEQMNELIETLKDIRNCLRDIQDRLPSDEKRRRQTGEQIYDILQRSLRAVPATVRADSVKNRFPLDDKV